MACHISPFISQTTSAKHTFPPNHQLINKSNDLKTGKYVDPHPEIMINRRVTNSCD
jgi:hypothetical protein